MAVTEPALSTLKFPAFTVTEPISIDFDDILSALARSLPVIEPSVMLELPTELALTDEAEIPVNRSRPRKPCCCGCADNVERG